MGCFDELQLLSFSQDVTGSVKAIFAKGCGCYIGKPHEF